MSTSTQPRRTGSRRARQPPAPQESRPASRPAPANTRTNTRPERQASIERIGDERIARDGITKLLLTIDEAARVLSVGRDKVYWLLHRGELRSVLVGASRRIPLRELEAYVERLLDATA